MKITICTSSHATAHVLPDTESEFYKELATIITQLPVPNTVAVSTPNGGAKYTLSTRSGTLLVTESSNNIYFAESAKYPTVYLTCVNAEHNNYKFYKLEDAGNGEVIATYGRIGTVKGELFGERNCRYPARMFWMKYQEKIEKGYVDKSTVYLNDGDISEDSGNKQENIAHVNEVAESLYKKLMSFSKKLIERVVKPHVRITKGMVAESRRLLNELYKTNTVEEFNTILKELIAVCPRKVWKVDELLAKTTKNFADIIEREEDLVNACAAVVGMTPVKESTDKFAAANISVKLASAKKKAIIMDMLDPSLRCKVKAIYRVKSKEHEARFKNYCEKNHIKEIKTLWHGSRNENWLSIIQNGLLLHPNAVITGKMFGNGIYFAPSCLKSWNYTSYRNAYWTGGKSDTAFMGLYATAYGKPEDVYNSYQYTKSMLDKKGKNCVHAHAGMALRNDEIIFYDESAMLLTYLVEFE